MIVKLDIRASQGGFVSLPLADNLSPFVVEEIGGLDPVKATLVSTSYAQQDGAQYQSSRREPRNITLQLGFEPDWVTEDVRTLRNRLFSVLMPKTVVDLTFFMLDGLEVTIQGVVESFESPTFTQEPVVNVSIMCFDPDFIDPDPILLNGTTTAGPATLNFIYAGTVDTGVVLRLMVNRGLSEFTIYHQASDGSLRTMDFQAPLIAGDVLTISTVSGSKHATLNRLGVDTSVLYGVSPQSSWLELTRGTNAIRVYAEGNPIPYTIQYLNRHGAL